MKAIVLLFASVLLAPLVSAQTPDCLPPDYSLFMCARPYVSLNTKKTFKPEVRESKTLVEE